MLSHSTPHFFGYYPGTVALVTARSGGARNVMAAGWHSALSSEPPLYGVLVGPERATYALIRSSGEFGVNFLPAEYARQVQGSGVLSLHDGADKFAALGLSCPPGEPLALEQAYLAYRCVVQEVVRTGDHDLFVGRVGATWFDPAFYDAARLFQGSAPVYLGRSAYVRTTREREVFLPEEFGGG